MYTRAHGKPECMYGDGCYRKSLEHWANFDHPATHAFLNSGKRATDGEAGPSSKRGPAACEDLTSEDNPVAAATIPLPVPHTAAASASSTTPAPAAAHGAARGVLIFAPGAGGMTAKLMYDHATGRGLHTDLAARGFAVWRCDDHTLGAGEARWNKFQPGHGSNVAHVIAVARRAAAAHPGVPLILCGASFGCRVLAEILREHRDALPAACVNGLICCGYPLHAPGKPENADPKRAAHLLKLPAGDLRVLFVQGTLDEFLGQRGIPALTDIAAQMACATQVVELPNGGHTVPGATRLREIRLTGAQVATIARDAILSFAMSFIARCE